MQNIIICNTNEEIKLLKSKILKDYMYICNESKQSFTNIKKESDINIIFSNNSKISFKLSVDYDFEIFSGNTLIYFNNNKKINIQTIKNNKAIVINNHIK
jgi:hypothetical protein